MERQSGGSGAATSCACLRPPYSPVPPPPPPVLTLPWLSSWCAIEFSCSKSSSSHEAMDTSCRCSRYEYAWRDKGQQQGDRVGVPAGSRAAPQTADLQSMHSWHAFVHAPAAAPHLPALFRLGIWPQRAAVRAQLHLHVWQAGRGCRREAPQCLGTTWGPAHSAARGCWQLPVPDHPAPQERASAMLRSWYSGPRSPCARSVSMCSNAGNRGPPGASPPAPLPLSLLLEAGRDAAIRTTCSRAWETATPSVIPESLASAAWGRGELVDELGAAARRAAAGGEVGGGGPPHPACRCAPILRTPCAGLQELGGSLWSAFGDGRSPTPGAVRAPGRSLSFF